MSDTIKSLLADYDGWEEDRAEVSEAEAEGRATANSWYDSDDTAVNLLERLVRVLREVSEFACAECGTTTAETYVVTTLDYDDAKGTRTEVCLSCHKVIS